MRTLVKYAKSDAAIYVSHLDTQRTIQRMLRRTNLPIKYTMGFHPHPVLTFAQPLSVGVSSKGDYFEFSLLEHIEPMRLKGIIASAMPKGFTCLDAGYIREEFPSLMAMVKRAEWEVTVDDVSFEHTKKQLSDMMTKDSVIIQKTTKRGIKDVDIRTGIHVVDIDGGGNKVKFSVVLSAGSTGNVAPSAFLKGMEIEHRYAQYHRVDLYYENNGIHLPLNNATRAV